MPICSNPSERRVKVPTDGGAVIMVLRNYSSEEYSRFMSGRFGFRKKGKIEDQSMQARIRFIDDLLIDIEAIGPDGLNDYVSYIDPVSGQEKRLDATQEDWKKWINPAWKISAALELEGESAEIENTQIKN